MKKILQKIRGSANMWKRENLSPLISWARIVFLNEFYMIVIANCTYYRKKKLNNFNSEWMNFISHKLNT
jgi:hypothetical protein